jgi:2-dehydropantoate 2-reductase
VNVAVLGLGGIGGMLVARTGALGIGTEGSVAAIHAGGLTLVHGGETTVAHPEVATRLDRPVGVLVVAIKAYALPDALDRIDPGALEDVVVLPLLNGLEHVAMLRETLGPQAVVAAGSIGRVEAFSPDPGVVVQRPGGPALLTAAAEALGRDLLATRLEPLAVPGIEIAVLDDERVVLWEKAARLAVLAAAAIASGRPVGELRTDPEWQPRVHAALVEACVVAAADGDELNPAAQWEIVEGLPESLVPSAARDAAVGRPTELDAITGSVIRTARRLGIRTPMLDGLLVDAGRHA